MYSPTTMMVKCAPRLATILCLYKHKASQQASKRRGRVFSVLIPISLYSQNARHLTWLGRLAMPIPSEKGAAIVHRRDVGLGAREERRGGGDDDDEATANATTTDGRGGQIPVVATLGGVCFCLSRVAAMRALPFHRCYVFHCHGPSLCR